MKEAKVKAPKAPKTPKAPKAPKTPKAPKAAKAAKAPKKVKGPKVKQEKINVPFFKSIRFRLIGSFLIPILCIIVLGIMSFQLASKALINSYKDSSTQTAEMMQQYMDLIVASEKDDIKSYLSNSDATMLMADAFNEVDAGLKRRSLKDELQNRLARDSKLEGVYLLTDGGRSVAAGSPVTEVNAYSTYMTTNQGQMVASDKFTWQMFGQDLETDDALGIKTEDYVLRMVRHYDNAKAVIVVNIDSYFVREAMQVMNPGKGGYVCFITNDGKEFYSDGLLKIEKNKIYGTKFYEKAVKSSNKSGNELVTVDGKKYLFVYSKMDLDGSLVTALIPESEMLAKANEIKQMTVIVTVVATLIALALGILMSSNMLGTISYILRQLGKVAKGDLTVQLVSKNQDEFGLLCNGVNQTVYHVKDLITNVTEISGELNDAASYVKDASGTFMETSNDIQGAVSEIEIGVNRLDSGSDDCMNQMDSLSGKITNVSTNASEIEKLTAATSDSINAGITSVQGLTKSAESTTIITQNVIEAIEQLEEKSKSISKIVLAINDIAEQTNLLSLNASIEAARAGDAGRGFSVVAEEIRKLSDQCLASSGQISEIVGEIVVQTGDVVKIARQAEDVVSSQAGAVEETTESFRMIDQQVEQLLIALQTISENVSKMDESRSGTMEAIESISAVSAETAACSSSVYTTAGTQLKAITELDAAAENLRARADKLVEVLETFQV